MTAQQEAPCAQPSQLEVPATLAPTVPLQPWYNIFGGRYNRSEPFFYDREKLPWTKVLEDNTETIRGEMLHMLAENDAALKPYFIKKSMSFPPRHWKTMGLLFWNLKMHRNCRRCPETMRILSSIPNLSSASLSILEPSSNINPHQGDTDAIIRCHLGLVIPGTLPDCAFQVGSEVRPWEAGKTLPFCDAHTHWSWNHTDKRRIIMILDVVRPEFARQTNKVCANVLADSVLQIMYQACPWLNKRVGWVKAGLYRIIGTAIRCLLPLQRRLPFAC